MVDEEPKAEPEKLDEEPKAEPEKPDEEPKSEAVAAPVKPPEEKADPLMEWGLAAGLMMTLALVFYLVISYLRSAMAP